jgi:hypothetical protein
MTTYVVYLMPNAPLIREESQFVVDAERYYVGESGALNFYDRSDKTVFSIAPGCWHYVHEKNK